MDKTTEEEIRELAPRCEHEWACADPDHCFPNQIESIPAFLKALDYDPKDSRASYYLGNFYYNARQYEDAHNYWQRSADLDDHFPTVFRNLALSYFNRKNETDKALKALTKAFSLNKKDARILFELDQLYKRLNFEPEKRLEELSDFPDLIESRDDLYLEKISLLNIKGEYENALELILNRKFHPWEGGEGKVTTQYVFSLTELAKTALLEDRNSEAFDYLERSRSYPENLGEGKLFGAQENDILFWQGLALKKLDKHVEAEKKWKEASTGLSEPTAAMFYNDQQPDKIFYQGLAHFKLGNTNKSNSRFNKLIDYGEKHIFDPVKIDYFAVSLPDLLIFDDDLNKRNEIHCKYLIALGNLGFGNHRFAENLFREILDSDHYHYGALIHLNIIEKYLKYLL